MYCHKPTQITECELNRKKNKSYRAKKGPRMFLVAAPLRDPAFVLGSGWLGGVGWGGVGQRRICTCKNNVMLRHKKLCIALIHPL